MASIPCSNIEQVGLTRAFFSVGLVFVCVSRYGQCVSGPKLHQRSKDLSFPPRMTF
jgi:hypothetical protein